MLFVDVDNTGDESPASDDESLCERACTWLGVAADVLVDDEKRRGFMSNMSLSCQVMRGVSSVVAHFVAFAAATAAAAAATLEHRLALALPPPPLPPAIIDARWAALVKLNMLLSVMPDGILPAL